MQMDILPACKQPESRSGGLNLFQQRRTSWQYKGYSPVQFLNRAQHRYDVLLLEAGDKLGKSPNMVERALRVRKTYDALHPVD